MEYTPKIIKDLLKEKGETLASIARSAGFSPSEVRNALYRPIFWGEQIIAEFLNIHPMKIWPQRYDEKGNPLHPHASANHVIPFSPKSKEKESGGEKW